MRELNMVEVEDVNGGLVLVWLSVLGFVATHTKEIGCFMDGFGEAVTDGN